MIINKKEFIKALEASAKFRERGQANLRILEMVKIDPEKGEVWATDLEAHAVSYFKATDFMHPTGGPESFCCDPKQLIGVLKTEADGDVEISLDDDKMSISVGKNFSTIPAINIDEFPDAYDTGGQLDLLYVGVTKLQLNTLTDLDCDKDEKREHIIAAYFTGKNGRVLSTDIKRLNMINIIGSNNHEPFGLLKKHLKICSCLAKEKVDIHQINEIFMVGIDNDVKTSVLLRPIDTEFPEVEDLIKKHDDRAVFAKEDIAEACRKAMLMSNGEFRGCEFNFNGKLKINMSNPVMGVYEDFLEYKEPIELQDITFRLDLRMLMDAIKNTEGDDVEFSIKDSESHVLLSKPGDDRNVNIIMSMKI